MITAVSVTIKKEQRTSVAGVVFKNNNEGSVIVQSLTERGLAQTSGLAVGDIVLKINGISVAKAHSSMAAKTLRDASGDVVIKCERIEKEKEEEPSPEEPVEEIPEEMKEPTLEKETEETSKEESAYLDEEETDVKRAKWCGIMFC